MVTRELRGLINIRILTFIVRAGLKVDFNPPPYSSLKKNLWYNTLKTSFLSDVVLFFNWNHVGGAQKTQQNLGIII